MINFGGIIKKKMKDKGMKQEALAKQLNIARTTVTAYCNNTRQPDLETVSKICNILEIDLKWLMELEDFDQSDMYIHDDFEQKVNSACKKVSKQHRRKFLDGVEYLADVLSEDEHKK